MTPAYSFRNATQLVNVRMALTKGIRAAAIEEDGCRLGLNHLIFNRKDRDGALAVVGCKYHVTYP